MYTYRRSNGAAAAVGASLVVRPKIRRSLPSAERTPAPRQLQLPPPPSPRGGTPPPPSPGGVATPPPLEEGPAPELDPELDPAPEPEPEPEPDAEPEPEPELDPELDADSGSFELAEPPDDEPQLWPETVQRSSIAA